MTGADPIELFTSDCSDIYIIGGTPDYSEDTNNKIIECTDDNAITIMISNDAGHRYLTFYGKNENMEVDQGLNIRVYDSDDILTYDFSTDNEKDCDGNWHQYVFDYGDMGPDYRIEIVPMTDGATHLYEMRDVFLY